VPCISSSFTLLVSSISSAVRFSVDFWRGCHFVFRNDEDHLHRLYTSMNVAVVLHLGNEFLTMLPLQLPELVAFE